MFAINALRNQAVRQIKRTNTVYIQARTKAKFKDGGEHATLNDVPIPQGCWKEKHTRRQNRYNIILLSGIFSLIGAVLFVANSDKMVFNYTIPDYPYEEEE